MRTQYTRVGPLIGGHDYQNLVALELLIAMLEDHQRYQWIKLEAEEAGFLDDVIALDGTGKVTAIQVKFAAHPADPTDVWTWSRLVTPERNKKASHLFKWCQSRDELSKLGPIAELKLVSNRKAGSDLAQALTPEGFADLDQIADAAMRSQVIQQCGGEVAAREFLQQFRFQVGWHNIDGFFNDVLRKRFLQGLGDDLGLLSLLTALRVWTRERDQPSADGYIRIEHIRDAITRYSIRTPLDQLALPQAPINFIGRQSHLLQLQDQLLSTANRPPVVLISGMGGVGKTALALRAAHDLAGRFPDGVIYLELAGARENPLSLVEGLKRLLRRLTFATDLPTSEAELIDLYRAATGDKAFLLILDDARGAQQTAPLIPGGKRCAVLITSRRVFRIAGVRLEHMDLNQLEEQEALELLFATAPRLHRGATNGQVVQELVELAGRLPLAIAAIAGYLDATEDVSPEEYANRLRDERHRLERLDDESLPIGVAASLSLSVKCLNEVQARVFGQLAVFPKRFDALAEEVICLDTDHVALSELVKWNLVEYDGQSGYYYLHDLVRLIAQRQIPEFDRHIVHSRHARFYLDRLIELDSMYRTGGELRQKAIRVLEWELPNIEVGQAWAAEHTHQEYQAAQLCDSYAGAALDFLDRRLRPKHRLQWYKDGLRAAQRLNDKSAEVNHLESIGMALADLGQFDASIEYYEQALQISMATGLRAGSVTLLNNLGIAYRQARNTAKAIENLKHSLALIQEVGGHEAEEEVLGNLGLAYGDLGDQDMSLHFHQRNLELASEKHDEHSLASAHSNVGHHYLAVKDYEQADKHFAQAIDLFTDLGDGAEASLALMNRGLAVDLVGRHEEALGLYRRALEHFQREGHQRYEIRALVNIGTALASLGRHTEAIEHGERAVKLAEAIDGNELDSAEKHLAAWRSGSNIIGW